MSLPLDFGHDERDDVRKGGAASELGQPRKYTFFNGVRAKVRGSRYGFLQAPMHPASLRCGSVEYARYFALAAPCDPGASTLSMLTSPPRRDTRYGVKSPQVPVGLKRQVSTTISLKAGWPASETLNP